MSWARARFDRSYPLVNLEDVIGGIHIPSDGYANAVDITQALAKGARARGAQIFQDLKVTAIRHDGRRVSGVETDAGPHRRRLRRALRRHVDPRSGGEHRRDRAAARLRALLRAVPGRARSRPRACRCCATTITAAISSTTPASFWSARSSRTRAPGALGGFPTISPSARSPGDFSHFEPVLLDAMRRIPALEQAGIQKFFCGPESFTPDVRYHLGESAELANCFVAAGLEFHRAAIRRRHRQGGLRMDSRRASADGSVGGRRPAQHAVPDQPQVSAGAGLRRAWVCCMPRIGPSASTRLRAACASPPCTTGWARRAHASARRSAGNGPIGTRRRA